MIDQIKQTESTEEPGIYFMGFHQNRRIKRYPAWRYCKGQDPVLVNNETEDKEAKDKGFEEINAPVMANMNMVNWFWDIEDMSPKQLCYFAKEEFGVDFPFDAAQENLQKAIFELIKTSPKNKGRLVLMAHTIKMNYAETQEEIRKLVDGDNPLYSKDVEKRTLEL